MGEIVSQVELILRCREWKRNGQRVVFTSGIFDLLHPGHIRLLEQARSLGDVLIVAIESDQTVRAKRCPGRPISPASERAEILAAMAAVDYAIELDGFSPDDLIANLEPEIVVQGGASDMRTAAKSTMLHIPTEPGYSTEALLEHIRRLHA